MKKLIVVMICVGLGFTAAAQKVRTVAVYHNVYAIHPVYGFGIGYYPPFYSPFGFYGLPYGAYYPYGNMFSRPSKLQREEEDIRSDYADRIYSVRQDDSLTNKQKRQEVRALKKQRDQEIHDLVVSYHQKPKNQNQDPQPGSQQPNPSVIQ
ncbi:MAG TPA: hypothetical protein VFI33_02700 [Puia sp.]|nr:hypothetical protein [Puia sp.]